MLNAKHQESERQGKLQEAELEAVLNDKSYLLTIEYENSKLLEELSKTGRYFKVCSLNEIHKQIQYMKEGFYVNDSVWANDPDERVNFKKGRWFGYNTRINIQPLTKELEEDFIAQSKQGFFDKMRQYFYGEAREILIELHEDLEKLNLHFTDKKKGEK